MLVYHFKGGPIFFGVLVILLEEVIIASFSNHFKCVDVRAKFNWKLCKELENTIDFSFDNYRSRVAVVCSIEIIK